MRKTIQYILLLTVLLTVHTTTVHSQSSRAIGEAFFQTLLEAGRTSISMDSLSKHLIEKYKEDPAVLTEIGRAYYYTTNFDEARSLYNKALALNPKFARALVGHGAVFKYRVEHYTVDNPEEYYDSTYYYYRKAVEAEPANQLACDSMLALLDTYRERYLKRHTQEDSLKAIDTYNEAIGVLTAQKENDPTAFVEPDMARLYMQMEKPSTAVELYQSVIDKLSAPQYFNYCMCLYSLEKYDETIEAANAGYERFPEYKDFCRPIFYSQSDKKMYGEAVQTYAQVLSLDTLFARDHTHAMICYLNLDNVKEATKAANRIYDTDDDNTLGAVNLISKTISGKARNYENLAEYDNAANVYLEYAEAKDYDKIAHWYNTKTTTQMSPDVLRARDMYEWALEYYKKVGDQFLEQTEKDRALEQCDEAFATIQEKFPEHNKEEVLYIRARILAMVDQKEEFANSRALPLYEQLVSIIENENENRNEDYLSQAYYYLTYYWYIIKKNTATGIAYAKKYKSLNPTDTTFDSIINSKTSSRRRR